MRTAPIREGATLALRYRELTERVIIVIVIGSAPCRLPWRSVWSGTPVASPQAASLHWNAARVLVFGVSEVIVNCVYVVEVSCAFWAWWRVVDVSFFFEHRGDWTVVELSCPTEETEQQLDQHQEHPDILVLSLPQEDRWIARASAHTNEPRWSGQTTGTSAEDTRVFTKRETKKRGKEQDEERLEKQKRYRASSASQRTPYGKWR